MTGSARLTFTISDPDTLAALAHPGRVRILEALREPASAAGLARRLGEPRQRINYHLKQLEKAGLVERAGERRAGNMTEVLYRPVARSFIVDPAVSWSDPARLQALADQHSLETLIELGGILQRDAITLLDRAAFDGEIIDSASVAAEVRFATPEDRAEFLSAYLRTLGPLLEQYGSSDGDCYRVVMAAYPDPRQEQP